MKKTFLSFKFWNTPQTTIGEPNPKTGEYSIAGRLHFFNSRKRRDEDIKSSTINYQEKCIPVSKRQARRLHAGYTAQEWEQFFNTYANI